MGTTIATVVASSPAVRGRNIDRYPAGSAFMTVSIKGMRSCVAQEALPWAVFTTAAM